MGEVWQARHILLGHKVAVKLLHPNVIQRPGARERFLREAQVMARLTTRRAVAVFDFGIMEDGAPYLVMEFVEGETLAEKIVREGRLSPLTTVKILSHAACSFNGTSITRHFAR